VLAPASGAPTVARMSPSTGESRPSVLVYVDGQNLFRRALKGTPYLWLDVTALCQQVLPRFEVAGVRYFTARVNPAPHDLHAGRRQDAYLAALESSSLVDVHLGRYRKDVLAMPVHPWQLDDSGAPRTVLVKRTIEKGSDVNLATHLLWDALHGAADAYAVLSNDSDLVTPIRMLRDLKGREVGVITPGAVPARDLVAAGSWSREIRTKTLAQCQLPRQVDTRGGVVMKPAEW